MVFDEIRLAVESAVGDPGRSRWRYRGDQRLVRSRCAPALRIMSSMSKSRRLLGDDVAEGDRRRSRTTTGAALAKHQLVGAAQSIASVTACRDEARELTAPRCADAVGSIALRGIGDGEAFAAGPQQRAGCSPPCRRPRETTVACRARCHARRRRGSVRGGIKRSVAGTATGNHGVIASVEITIRFA